MIFVDKLIDQIKAKKSHLVVGLDPVYNYLPPIYKWKHKSIKSICNSILDFNQKIIDAIFDLVPAVKPQIAFYETFGLEGIKLFNDTVIYAKKKGLLVIEDAKRNDIGSTATAYSTGHIGRITIEDLDLPAFDVDAVTINPYLGSDGILPFIKDANKYDKGLFILVKTSNPSSGEIQDIVSIEGKKVYVILAERIFNYSKENIGVNSYSSIGVVVGATYPLEAKQLREILPYSYFLVPGYGAQGGKASDLVSFFNKDGLGAVISSSRNIIYAFKEEEKKLNDYDFALCTRNAVLKSGNEINSILRLNKLISW